MKKSTLEQVSTHLDKLFDLYPFELKEPKSELRAGREAFARMWADNALREAIENIIRFQNRNLIASTDEKQHIYFKARIDTLVQLLAWGKQNFVQFATLTRKPITEEDKFHELEKQLERPGEGTEGAQVVARDEGIRSDAAEGGAHPETEPSARAKGKK